MLTRMSNDLERRVLNQEFAEYKASREEIVNEKVRQMEEKLTAMMNSKEEALNERLDQVNQIHSAFEAQLNLKLREIDAALAVRPVETLMREAIRDACKKSAHDVEEPLIKEIKEARRRIEVLDGDIFRVKNMQTEGLAALKEKDAELLKIIEKERGDTDKKLDA